MATYRARSLLLPPPNMRPPLCRGRRRRMGDPSYHGRPILATCGSFSDWERQWQGVVRENFHEVGVGKVCPACPVAPDRTIAPCVQEFVLTRGVHAVTFMTAG